MAAFIYKNNTPKSSLTLSKAYLNPNASIPEEGEKTLSVYGCYYSKS